MMVIVLSAVSGVKATVALTNCNNGSTLSG